MLVDVYFPVLKRKKKTRVTIFAVAQLSVVVVTRTLLAMRLGSVMVVFLPCWEASLPFGSMLVGVGARNQVSLTMLPSDVGTSMWCTSVQLSVSNPPQQTLSKSPKSPHLSFILI